MQLNIINITMLIYFSYAILFYKNNTYYNWSVFNTSTAEAWMNASLGPFLFWYEFIEKINPGWGIPWMEFHVIKTQSAIPYVIHFPSVCTTHWLFKNILMQGISSRLITETKWLYLSNNMLLQTLCYFNLITVLTHRKTQTEYLPVL